MRLKSTILKDLIDQSVVCICWTGNDEILIGRYNNFLNTYCVILL